MLTSDDIDIDIDTDLDRTNGSSQRTSLFIGTTASCTWQLKTWLLKKREKIFRGSYHKNYTLCSCILSREKKLENLLSRCPVMYTQSP